MKLNEELRAAEEPREAAMRRRAGRYPRLPKILQILSCPKDAELSKDAALSKMLNTKELRLHSFVWPMVLPQVQFLVSADAAAGMALV